MTVWEGVGFGVLSAVLSFVLRECKCPFHPLPALLGAVCLFADALPKWKEVFSLFSVWEETGLTSYLLPIGKVLGVGYLGELGEEIGKELGANGAAWAISFFAKTELLLLSLPFAESLLEKAGEVWI